MKIFILPCSKTPRLPIPHFVAVREDGRPLPKRSPYTDAEGLPFVFPDEKELREYIFKHGDFPVKLLEVAFRVTPDNY